MIFGSDPEPLKSFSVGLSGAVPEARYWSEPALDRAILEFVAHFSGLVFRYGGRIVHGGHPSFTPLLLHQAERHGGERRRPPLMLVISALWPEAIEEYRSRRYASVAEVLVTPAVGDGGPGDPVTRNLSLALLRQGLVEQMNTLVAVGGKYHRDDRKRPGVIEEVALAIQRGMACFLVGGLGGMTGELAAGLADPATLRNALTAEENDSLSQTRDVASCVQFVFSHLLSHPELAGRSLVPLARREEEQMEAGASAY